jgi:flagellar motility protein MotE (MotC chaperone)
MKRGLLVVLMVGAALTPWAAEEKKPAEGGGAEVSSTLPAEVPQIKQGRVFTDTEVQLLLELDQQRIELQRRAEALELREKLVDLMEQRLNGRVVELQQLKVDLEKLLVSVSGKDSKELDQLAAIYSAMKPSAAAVVLNRLDNPIVLDIFTRMAPKKSGKLMEAIDPAKARYISQMMAARTPPPVVSETTPAPVQ